MMFKSGIVIITMSCIFGISSSLFSDSRNLHKRISCYLRQSSETQNDQLFEEVSKDNPNLEKIAELLNDCADANASHESCKDCLPFNNKIEKPISVARNVNVLKLLLDHGAFVDEIDGYEFEASTPLLKAIQRKDKDSIRLLLKHHANINAPLTNFHEYTPLQFAVYEQMGGRVDNPEIVQLLLDLGAAVNRANLRGVTALHIAAEFGLNNITTILLKYGADVKLRDDYGHTPLADLVLPLNNWDSPKVMKTAELLIQAGSDASAVNPVLDYILGYGYITEPTKYDLYNLLVKHGAKAFNKPHSSEKAKQEEGQGQGKTEYESSHTGSRFVDETAYAILGVLPTASDSEIRKAYHELAVQWHPDKHRADFKLATQKMAEINDAYEKIKKMRKPASEL